MGAGPVVIGDLNSDGKPDLASPNSLLFGKGDGSFGGRVDYSAGGSDVAIGDLNGDGKLDLVTAQYSSGTLSVLLGNGDGSFGVKTDYGTGLYPTRVAIGDLNGDGKPDLATANTYSSTVSVLLGNGDGSFGAKTDYGTGSNPNSVAIGDLNGDGKPDLATANNLVSTVSVLLGNGDGSFGAKTDYVTGTYPISVAIGDLNGDGEPDLVTANPGQVGEDFSNNTVSVLIGNGDGSFGAKTDYPTGLSPYKVVIGDLNGDGKPDLATANVFRSHHDEPQYRSHTVSVLLGTGYGSFGARTDYETGPEPYSLAIGDLNIDGKPDLAVAETNGVSVLLGNGDGSFQVPDYAAGPGSGFVAIGDLNIDGKPDLVTAGTVLLGNGDGSFGGRIDHAAGVPAIGDLNGDGKPDLATANGYSPNTVSVLLGNGDGTFGVKTDYGTGGPSSSVAIGDLNGDGKPDLATANYGLGFNTGTVSVLLGNGDGSFGVKTDYGTGADPRSLAIGDLNGDGKADLVTASDYPSPSVSVLLGNGDGSFGAKADYDAGGYSVAIGDLNGDGKLDLATVGTNGPCCYSIAVLLGNGDGSFGAKTDYDVGDIPYSVAIGDLNGDGKPDLATTMEEFHRVAVLLGNGDGSFGEKTEYGTGNFPFSVAIGDLNGDGKLDLATGSLFSQCVSVLLNIGAGPPPVAVAVDLDPNVLNLNSMGRWVACYLEPPAPLTANQIDVGSVKLDGVVPVDPSATTAIGDHDGNGTPDLMVKFDRAAVELAVGEGDAVTVTVTGKVDGRPFSGTDVIRVKRAVVSAPAAGSALTVGSVTAVIWETPAGVNVASVALLYSVDDGTSWTVQTRDLPNTGRCDWIVPNVVTDQARIAVVLVESSDATGDVVTGVLGTSGKFSIQSPTATWPQQPIALALRGANPNPALERFHVDFSLPDAQPASLALYDLIGRKVAARAVGGLGPGRHTIEMGERGLPAGIYVIRLSQGGRLITARAALIH